MDQDVLDVMAAAELLGVGAGTVRHEARAGRLPGRRVGRVWRFSRRALLNWLAAADDDEPLSAEDLTAVCEGLAALERGDFVTLEEYDRLRARPHVPQALPVRSEPPGGELCSANLPPGAQRSRSAASTTRTTSAAAFR